MQRNPATPPLTDSTEVPLLTSPSNVTPSMSTGGSADCSANCSDGSANSSAAGSAGGSAACVGSSADGSNGSGSQGLSPDTGDVEVVLILLHFFLIVKSLNSQYVFSNLQCWEACQHVLVPKKHDAMQRSSGLCKFLFGDFQGKEIHLGVSRESQLKLPSNRNSKFISRGAPHGLVQFSTAS